MKLICWLTDEYLGDNMVLLVDLDDDLKTKLSALVDLAKTHKENLPGFHSIQFWDHGGAQLYPEFLFREFEWYEEAETLLWEGEWLEVQPEYELPKNLREQGLSYDYLILEVDEENIWWRVSPRKWDNELVTGRLVAKEVL